MDKGLYKRTIIDDRISNPHNFSLNIPKDYVSVEQKKPGCSDKFIVGLKIENKIITDGIFNGQGCSISKSSLDILLDHITGKHISKVNEILSEYKNIVTKGISLDQSTLPKELSIFNDISKYPNRVGCALLGLTIIEDILESSK